MADISSPDRNGIESAGIEVFMIELGTIGGVNFTCAQYDVKAVVRSVTGALIIRALSVEPSGETSSILV